MDLALANAHWVLDFQGGAGVERTVQDAFGGVWMTLLSHIYLAAQIVVLPGVLLAMYRWAPRIYPRLRDTVIATWMLSLPVYALFPVAPPRLAGLGMTDAVSETVGGRARRALDAGSTTRSRPSRACTAASRWRSAIAVAAAVKQRWLKVLALSWGPLVALSTVATANHYVFDVAAGLAVTASATSSRAAARPRPVAGGGVRMIRVAVRDHHPATCAGVNAILDEHAGVVGGRRRRRPARAAGRCCTGPTPTSSCSTTCACASPCARGSRRRGSCCTPPDAGFGMIVPAAFAGAHALVDKTCSPAELVAAIRGEHGLPVDHAAPAAARRGAARRRPTARSWRCGWRARRTARSPRSSGSTRARWPRATRDRRRRSQAPRSLRSTARASSTRDETPTLPKMLRRCVSTVFLDRKSAAAICVFVWRSTTRRAISSSRAVSASRPLAPAAAVDRAAEPAQLALGLVAAAGAPQALEASGGALELRDRAAAVAAAASARPASTRAVAAWIGASIARSAWRRRAPARPRRPGRRSSSATAALARAAWRPPARSPTCSACSAQRAAAWRAVVVAAEREQARVEQLEAARPPGARHPRQLLAAAACDAAARARRAGSPAASSARASAKLAKAAASALPSPSASAQRLLAAGQRESRRRRAASRGRGAVHQRPATSACALPDSRAASIRALDHLDALGEPPEHLVARRRARARAREAGSPGRSRGRPRARAAPCSRARAKRSRCSSAPIRYSRRRAAARAARRTARRQRAAASAQCSRASAIRPANASALARQRGDAAASTGGSSSARATASALARPLPHALVVGR